ncbi:hypothetical protein LIER_03957 [Lithospermum erythrorhizon]|uniref:Uncharacterized protein n=1 Tax=Lithospermum erythrorhizon TaxID=34254 RepID=A0AAV3NV65_LITER
MYGNNPRIVVLRHLVESGERACNGHEEGEEGEGEVVNGGDEAEDGGVEGGGGGGEEEGEGEVGEDCESEEEGGGAYSVALAPLVVADERVVNEIVVEDFHCLTSRAAVEGGGWWWFWREGGGFGG